MSQYHSQTPGWFHQKVFNEGLNDIAPYGFTDHPRSIVCPLQEICNAFLADRNWSDEQLINIVPWFIDYRDVPGRKYI